MSTNGSTAGDAWQGEWFRDHPLAHLVFDTTTFEHLVVNRAAAERYGYDEAELTSMTRFDLVVPEEHAVLRSFIARLPASMGEHPVWTERHRDGSLMRSDIRGYAVRFAGRAARLVVVMDAGPRARLEQEAATQRELWHVAGRMASVGGWSLTLPDRRLTWSDEVCAIHGHPPGYQPTREEAAAAYGPAAAGRIQSLVANCAQHGQPFDTELPFGTDATRQRWVRVAGVPVYDAQGARVRVEGLMQEITQRKLAELALADSRDRLAATLKAIPDLWFILDAEGRYQEVSDPNHSALIGRWEDAIGRRFDEIAPAALGVAVMDGIRATRSTRKISAVRYELQTRTSGWRHFEGRLVPMDDGRFLYLTRDVTDLHAAQAAAEERAASLQALLAAIPTLWFVFDADDRYESVSREDHPELVEAWETIRGRRVDDVLGSSLGPECRRVLREARDASRPQRLDYELVNFAGERLRFEGRAVPLPEGRVLFLAHDVTSYERTQAELRQQAQTIRELHEQQRAVLNALPDLWFALDANERYLEVSDADHPSLSGPWERMRGRLAEEIDPPSLAARMREARQLARSTGQPQSYRYPMAVRSGEHREFEARAIAMSDGRTLTLVRDITESVALDQRFRDIAEAAPVGIYQADASGACVYMNAFLTHLLGLQSGEGLGNGWTRGLHPEDRPRVAARWNQAVAEGSGSNQEFRVVRGDGTVRTLASRNSPTRDPGGRVTGFVGAVVDITEREQLEQARRAQAVSEEARRRQSAFLSRMSHEMRTPLNAILGFGQLLELELLPGTGAFAQLRQITQAGEHLLQLVDDLLQLQRLTQATPAPRALNLAETVIEALELLQPLARQRNVQTRALASPAPLVMADPRLLRQLLVQLGALAIRGSAAGQRVRFTSGHDIESGAWLLVETPGRIAGDDGLASVFAPLVTVAAAEGDEGATLGMLIVRELARQIGGTLTVNAAETSGLRVALTLPLAPTGEGSGGGS